MDSSSRGLGLGPQLVEVVAQPVLPLGLLELLHRLVEALDLEGATDPLIEVVAE